MTGDARDHQGALGEEEGQERTRLYTPEGPEPPPWGSNIGGSHIGGSTIIEGKLPRVNTTGVTSPEEGTEHAQCPARGLGCADSMQGSPWLLIPTAFLVHFITSGVSYSIGLYYVTFLDVFKESAALTSWIGSLNYATLCATGPLASYLGERFGLRLTVMAGGVMAGLGLVISSYASGIYTLYLSYGLLAGVGYGLCYTCAVVAIGINFTQGRTLAMGVAMSGVGCGNFCYPFLAGALLERYGWRGSLLITAGITFNVVALGGLLNPTLCAPATRTDSNENIVKKNGGDAKRGELKLWADKLDIFKNFDYLLIHLSTVLFCFGLSVVFTHISAYSETQGLTFTEATSLISAQGICNLFGRVLLGVLSHDSRVNIRVLHITCYFLSGLGVALCTVMTSYPGLITCMCVFGTFSAAYGPVLTEVIADVVGIERFSFGYGFLMISMATGTLIGAPSAGWLYDMSGVYAGSLYLGGGVIICSALVMIPSFIVGIVVKYKHKHGYYSKNLQKTTQVISEVEVCAA